MTEKIQLSCTEKFLEDFLQSDCYDFDIRRGITFDFRRKDTDKYQSYIDEGFCHIRAILYGSFHKDMEIFHLEKKLKDKKILENIS